MAVKESLEFTEAERDALLDANTELESQLKVVRGQLEEYRLTHQNPRQVYVLEPGLLGGSLYYPELSGLNRVKAGSSYLPQ